MQLHLKRWREWGGWHHGLRTVAVHRRDAAVGQRLAAQANSRLGPGVAGSTVERGRVDAEHII